MKNLGETLKQARAAKGVEIRDASDATKVRSDFLRHMENGDFDFDLPEIYKRGFLRLYAAYLGLDPKAIMADYDAFRQGKNFDKESARGHKAKEQFFGEMTAQDDAPISPEKRYDDESPTRDMPKGPADSLDKTDTVKAPYVKIAAIVAAVILGVIVIVALVSSLSSDDTSEPSGSPEIAGATSTELSNAQVPNGDAFTISIIALNDTYYKLTPDSDRSKFLHIGEVRRGEIKTFKTTEPLILTPMVGKVGDLRIERNGESIDLSRLPITASYKIVAPKKK